MSFLTDLFKGNWGNLGEDLSPGNIFKDFGSSFKNQPEWAKIAEFALPAIATGGALLAPELLAGGAAAEGGLAAAETAGAATGGVGGFDLASIGPGLAAGGEFADPTAAALAGAGAIPEGSAALPALSETTAGAANPFVTGSTEVPFYNDPAAGGLPGISMSTGTGPTATWADAASANVAGSAAGGGVGGPSADVASIQGLVDSAPPGGLTGGAGPVDLGRAVYSGGAMQGIEGVGPVAQPEGPTTLGTIGSTLKAAAPYAGVAALGANLYSGYQSSQALKALQQQETDYQNKIAQAGQASLSAAKPMIDTAEALMGTSAGPVPAPMQALLDNYRNGQRARVIQSYTSQGLSGDPNKNTSLMQDLNAVDNQMLALRESIGNQILTTANTMLSQGVSATNIAAELPIMMQRLDIALQQQTGNAIANFAAAMSGGTMKVAGQGAGNININTGNPLLTG